MALLNIFIFSNLINAPEITSKGTMGVLWQQITTTVLSIVVTMTTLMIESHGL